MFSHVSGQLCLDILIRTEDRDLQGFKLRSVCLGLLSSEAILTTSGSSLGCAYVTHAVGRGYLA